MLKKNTLTQNYLLSKLHNNTATGYYGGCRLNGDIEWTRPYLMSRHSGNWDPDLYQTIFGPRTDSFFFLPRGWNPLIGHPEEWPLHDIKFTYCPKESNLYLGSRRRDGKKQKSGVSDEVSFPLAIVDESQIKVSE